MKPYPRYKSTGLPWLPSVPEHWEVGKLRNLVKQPLQYGANASGLFYDSEKPRYIRITDIDENGALKSSGMQSLSWDDAQPYMLTDGDVLFARSGATVGKTFLFRSSFGNCCFAGYLIRCKPNRNRIAPEYLSYYSLSNNYKNWLNRSTIQATIQNVSAEKYKEMPLPIPPPSEQSRIVRYLDEKTAAIDELVRAKEREIELLRERKQVLITAAVMGGLDPSTERKDSGVPCIGKIPKHWEVVKFKRIATVRANLVSPDNYMDCPQIAPECIEKDSGRLVQFRTVRDAGVVSGNHLFTKGQILYSKIRPTLNKVVIAPTDGLCSADMYPIETNQTNTWLVYFMLSSVFVQQVREFCARVKMPKINKEDLGQLFVLVPPPSEQRRVVAHLDSVCADFAAAETAIRKQISLLQEFRTRLVSDAVTGAVEVTKYGVET